jgi:hypothetical protein
MKDGRESSMQRMALLELYGTQDTKTENRHRETRVNMAILRQVFAAHFP